MDSNYGVGSAVLFLWFDAVVFFALVLLLERLQRRPKKVPKVPTDPTIEDVDVAASARAWNRSATRIMFAS
jgi:hypothetical protein